MNQVNVMSFLIIILIPSAFAVLALILPARIKGVKEVTVLAGVTANLASVFHIYGKSGAIDIPWVGFGINFSLKIYQFSGMILSAAAIISFLVVLYTTAFLKGKPYAKQFYAYLLFTITLVNGAVLANNLAVMLFFWEGILVTLFAMIMTGGDQAYKTSVKSIVIVGLTDLCMMLGIGMTGYLAQTLTMDKIHLPLTSWGIFAFILLLIGALGKAGCMPFHTWIPDAADNAPLPFMALLPGSLEKLLGIYFLTRICLDLFEFNPGSSMSYLLMIIGAVTILFAVMMALIQKDFKRLLSYHAVSQVGYMILGIGTALPVGIIGGLFHMINNAIYKCCLFLVAGSVERQAGTTDLKKVSGLGRKMPVTFICFIVAAASISGFPFTNGFFSKELIFDGALESGLIFYIAAAVGAFFTAVSFLKLGHAAFFGETNKENSKVKEAPLLMLIPMIVLALGCLVFGFGNSWVIRDLLQPALGSMAETGEAIGSQTNWVLVGISMAVLTLAVLDHFYGFKKTGRGINAADHFHYAPVLRNIYAMAEKKYFDPYHIGGYAIRGYATLALWINDSISWFYDTFVVWLVSTFSSFIRKAHNGSQARYLGWILAGVAIVTMIFLVSV